MEGAAERAADVQFAAEAAQQLERGLVAIERLDVAAAGVEHVPGGAERLRAGSSRSRSRLASQRAAWRQAVGALEIDAGERDDLVVDRGDGARPCSDGVRRSSSRRAWPSAVRASSAIAALYIRQAAQVGMILNGAGSARVAPGYRKREQAPAAGSSDRRTR